MATAKNSYAIIALGGKQYRVREGERLLVDRLSTDEGKTFTPDVLFVGGDGEGTLSPKTKVTAKVVGHVLGEKVRIGKHRPKTGYRRHTGFRARLSQIEIQAIGSAGRSSARAEAPESKTAADTAAQPPRGYADLTVAEITDRSKRWKSDQVEAALEFERAHANRKGAIAVLESSLAAKQEKEG